MKENTENKRTDDTFIINEINKIREKVLSLHSTDLDSIRASIANLISADIPPELLSMINELNFMVDAQKYSEMSIIRSNNILINKKNAHDAREELRDQFSDLFKHEMQEQEIMVSKEEYNKFESKFSEKLDRDNKLLEKAIEGKELNSKEKAKLTGEYADDQEKIKIEQKWEKKAEKWEKIYTLEEKLTESLKYKREMLSKIGKLLETEGIPLEKKAAMLELKKEQQQKIEEHSKTLENIQRKYLKRDKELELLTNENLDEKIVCNITKKHQHIHGKFYEKEYLKNPEHKASKIMQALVQKTIKQVEESGRVETKSLQPGLISFAKNINKDINASHLVNLKDEATLSNTKASNLKENSSNHTIPQGYNSR